MPFEFNLYSSLLLPPFIQGILWFFLLLKRGIKEERLSDKLLALLILIYTFWVANWMLGFAGWYDVHNGFTTFMFYFPFRQSLFLAPLVYFYFKSVTNHQFKFTRSDFYHFIPALVSLFIFVACWVVDAWVLVDFPFHYGTKGNAAEFILDKVRNIEGDYLGYISTLIYLAMSLKLYYAYQNYLQTHFSDTENLDFKWFRNFLLAILGVSIGFLCLDLWDLGTGRDLGYKIFWFGFLITGIAIYYLGHGGYYRISNAAHLLQFEPETTEMLPEETVLLQATKQIISFMEIQKPYLQPELSLYELANQMGMRPTQLSRTLNQQFGKNFNDFINEYRVKAVKEALQNLDNKHLSLLGVALNCGFNSKATFNRVFQKIAGESPSQFQQKQGSNS